MSCFKHRDKWKHNLIPIEISKNDSDKVMDLLLYKNHYALIKKLNVSLGDHNTNSICRQCLNYYTNGNTLRNHKKKCENYDITTIGTSLESYLHWKKLFLKNPSYFRIFADLEADNEVDNSNISIKTTKIFKQNPVCNGYYIRSESEDVLESGYYESFLEFNNVDWYVNEVK